MVDSIVISIRINTLRKNSDRAILKDCSYNFLWVFQLSLFLCQLVFINNLLTFTFPPHVPSFPAQPRNYLTVLIKPLAQKFVFMCQDKVGVCLQYFLLKYVLNILRKTKTYCAFLIDKRQHILPLRNIIKPLLRFLILLMCLQAHFIYTSHVTLLG